jgi:adiponectin receptor
VSLSQGEPLNRGKVLSRVGGTAIGYYIVVIYRGVAAAFQAGICTELITAVAMLFCHGFGAACYALHWPQRHYPRIFDLCVSFAVQLANNYMIFLIVVLFHLSYSVQGFSHNLMHIFCFAIYVCGYPYMALLHSKKEAWFGV